MSECPRGRVFVRGRPKARARNVSAAGPFLSSAFLPAGGAARGGGRRDGRRWAKGQARKLGKEGRTALGNVVVKALSVPVEKACRLVLMVVAARMLGAAALRQLPVRVRGHHDAGALHGSGNGRLDDARAGPRSNARAGHRGDGAAPAPGGSFPYLVVVALAAALAGPGDTRRALALLGLAALVNAFVDYMLAIFRGFERLADEAHLNVARALSLAAGGLGALALHPTVGRAVGGALRGDAGGRLYGLRLLRRGYGLDARAGRFDRELAGAAAARGDPALAGDAVLAALLQGGRRHPEGVRQRRRDRRLQRGLQDLRRADDRAGGGAGGHVPAAGARQGRSRAPAPLGGGAGRAVARRWARRRRRRLRDSDRLVALHLRRGVRAGRAVAARAGRRAADPVPELRPHPLPDRARSRAAQPRCSRRSCWWST